MIYKFKSAASADVILLGPHGDRVLQLLGREPAPQGVLEGPALAHALQALQDAIAAEEAVVPSNDDVATGTAAGEDSRAEAEPAVALRQRLWPLMDMLRRAQAEHVRVVWGV